MVEQRDLRTHAGVCCSSQDGVGSAVEEEEAVANLMAAGQKMKCGASQDDGKEDEEEQICSNLNVRKRRVIVPFTGVCAHNTCWLYISAVCLMAPVRASDDTETSANTKQLMGDISNGQGLVPTGFNYTKYVEAQLRKTDTIALAGQTGQWVVDETIQFIARYVTEHLPMSRRFALCHGARSGREALWFRKRLPGMQVWGTELSPVAAAQAPWTVPWDFHAVRPEWRGAVDFVYSNALDHSFNATLAISSWLEELAPGGAVLVHWAGGASKATGIHKDTDIFSASRVSLMQMFCNVGMVIDVVLLPTPRQSWYGGKAKKGQQLFVVQRRAVAGRISRWCSR